MKSFAVTTTFFAMFAAAVVALPHNNGHYHDFPYGHSEESVNIGGCNNEGGVGGIANNLLKGGILSNNEENCRQTVVQHHDHDD